MSSTAPTQAKIQTVARFPTGYFLENLAIRQDGSTLVSAMNKKELWIVPPPREDATVEPVLLHTFGQPTLGIVEIEPDVFFISTSNLYTTHESYLHRLDMRSWQSGTPVTPDMVFEFPNVARGLNGSCLVAPGVVFIADSFASLIWRVNFDSGGSNIRSEIWLQHDSMGYYPGKMKPEQPGVNGVRYASNSNYLYYTATAKKLLMRVKVDSRTFAAAGEPELVVAGRMGDDFCIDERAGYIYLATHRQNTIDRVSMDPGENSGFTQSIVGDPFTEQMIGPSSGTWGRGDSDYGRVAYFITDGGTASPPPGGAQPASIIRVELPSAPEHVAGFSVDGISSAGAHSPNTRTASLASEMETNDFGGRLPLFDPSTLTEAQTHLYERLQTRIVPWATKSGFRVSAESGAMIGPFNPILASPEIAMSFLDFQDAETASTSLSESERQVVILTVGSVWQAAYELYAHTAVSRKAGLSSATIDALIAGIVARDLSPREESARQFTRQLVTERRVDRDLYVRASEAFGTTGVMDMVFLIGAYLCVCSILNCFDIPAPPAEAT